MTSADSWDTEIIRHSKIYWLTQKKSITAIRLPPSQVPELYKMRLECTVNIESAQTSYFSPINSTNKQNSYASQSNKRVAKRDTNKQYKNTNKEKIDENNEIILIIEHVEKINATCKDNLTVPIYIPEKSLKPLHFWTLAATLHS